MGIIFENGLGIGTVPNNTNGGSGQWYLATGPFGYQPAWNDNVISWPMNTGNYGSFYGTIDPNEILGNSNAGIYINIIDSIGTIRYDLLSALVGRTGTITFRQGGNHITFGFTPGTFNDNTNMYGSISWGIGSSQLLTLISTSNTTFTGYEYGDYNMSGGPITYIGSGIAPNNSELVTITYTTDAPSFTLTSNMFDRMGSYGSACGAAQGEFINFTGLTITQASNLLCGAYAQLSDYTAIQNAFTAAGATTDYSGYICDVTWGPGSTVPYGIAKVSYNTYSGNSHQIEIVTVDPSDLNYSNNDNNPNLGTSLVGTFNFPATFTFRTPLDNKGGWC
jgi:hypothetical protein